MSGRLDETRDIVRSADEQSALIHREIFQLGALIVIAVAAFFLTRAVAASNREMSLRDAAEWFRRGQQAIQQGHIDEAIESLRRAAIRDRGDKVYVLALARALALKHDDEGARGVLMTLRDSEPDDRDINLQLARLETQLTRELVDLVLSRDPLAIRIGSAERRRRLTTDVAYVYERLHSCVEKGGGNTDLSSLESEVKNFQAALTPRQTVDQDTVEAGVDLIDRVERGTATRCGPATMLVQSLALIGRRHAAEAR